MKLRPTVKWFAEQMELKLRENDHKGGWHSCPPESLTDRIGQELRELRRAQRKVWVASLGSSERAEKKLLTIREAANVGAMAMMVADHFREDGPSEDQGGTL